MNCPRVSRDLILGLVLVSYKHTVALPVGLHLIRSLFSSTPASNNVLAQCPVPSANVVPSADAWHQIKIQRSVVSLARCYTSMAISSRMLFRFPIQSECKEHPLQFVAMPEGVAGCLVERRHVGALTTRSLGAGSRVGRVVLAFRTRGSGRATSKVRRRTPLRAGRLRRALPLRKSLGVVVVLVALNQVWHLISFRDMAGVDIGEPESWGNSQITLPHGFEKRWFKLPLRKEGAQKNVTGTHSQTWPRWSPPDNSPYSSRWTFPPPVAWLAPSGCP